MKQECVWLPCYLHPAWAKLYKDVWAACLVTCIGYPACTSGCNCMGGWRLAGHHAQSFTSRPDSVDVEGCGPTRQCHNTYMLHPLIQAIKQHLSFFASDSFMQLHRTLSFLKYGSTQHISIHLHIRCNIHPPNTPPNIFLGKPRRYL